MSQQRKALCHEIIQLLENVEIGQHDYEQIRFRAAQYGYTEFEAQECLAWLNAQKAWPDALLEAPDGVLEGIRETNDLERDAKALTDSQSRKAKMFDRKGIYHSELVKAGAVQLTIVGDVRESKKKGEYYVEVEVDGTQHYINIENDGVKATLENLPRGTPLTLRAYGSRDSATVSVDEAPTLNDISQAKKAPAPAKPTPNIQPSTALADQLKQCLKVAHDIEVWYEQEFGEPLSENARALAINLAIEKSHSPNKQLVA